MCPPNYYNSTSGLRLTCAPGLMMNGYTLMVPMKKNVQQVKQGA